MRINGSGFGYIIVDGVRYGNDIVLCIDRVFERPKYLSREYRRLYNHTPLSCKELEYILSFCSGFEKLVIATGQYGALPLMDDARELLKSLEKSGVEVIVEETPKAVDTINKLLEEGARVAAVIHVTC